MPAVEMQVKQVSLDPVLGAPVVILEEKDGGRSVPIWVGQTEAAAIVSELREVPLARPSSHDLMNEIIFRLRNLPEKFNRRSAIIHYCEVAAKYMMSISKGLHVIG